MSDQESDNKATQPNQYPPQPVDGIAAVVPTEDLVTALINATTVPAQQSEVDSQSALSGPNPSEAAELGNWLRSRRSVTKESAQPAPQAPPQPALQAPPQPAPQAPPQPAPQAPPQPAPQAPPQPALQAPPQPAPQAPPQQSPPPPPPGLAAQAPPQPIPPSRPQPIPPSRPQPIAPSRTQPPKKSDFLFNISSTTSTKLKALFHGSDLLHQTAEPSASIELTTASEDLTSTGAPAEAAPKTPTWAPTKAPTPPSARPESSIEHSSAKLEQAKGEGLFRSTSTKLKALFLGPKAEPNEPEYDLPESEWLTSDAESSASAAPEPTAWTMPESKLTQQERKLKKEFLQKAGPKAEPIRSNKSRVEIQSKPTKLGKWISAHRFKVITAALIPCLVFFLWLVGHPFVAQQFVNSGVEQLSKGHPNDALTSFDRAIQVDGQSASAYFNRGNAHRKKGDFKKAFDDYSMSLKLSPKSVSALDSRASLCLKLENYEQAVSDYTLLFGFAANEKKPQMYDNRAAAYAGLGQYDKALQDYRVALKTNPKDSKAHTGSSFCQLQLDRYAKIEARAVADTSKGDYANALQEYNQVQKIPRFQPSLAFYLDRANVYAKMKEYEKAVADYSVAIHLSPNQYQSYLKRAQCYAQLKNYKLAVADCTTAAKLSPKTADVYQQRGTIMEQFGNPMSAYQDFTTAISFDKKNIVSYISRGRCSLAKQDFTAALQDFDQALKIDPDNADVLALRKQTMASKAPRHSVATAVHETTAETPSYNSANLSKLSTANLIKNGYNLLNEGSEDSVNEAIPMLAEAVKRSPNDTSARRYLAHAFLLEHKPAFAIEQFEALRTLKALLPADRMALEKALPYGNAHRAASRFLEAPQAENQTAPAEPQTQTAANPQNQFASNSELDVRYKLVLEYAKSGRTDDALRECTTGMNQSPPKSSWQQRFYQCYTTLQATKNNGYSKVQH